MNASLGSITSLWLRDQQSPRLRIAVVHDQATLGSANSNSIILKSKSIPALKGIFLKEDRGWIFKDFQVGQEILLESGSVLKLGPHHFEVLQSKDSKRCLEEKLSQEFRRLLSQSAAMNLDSALDQLRLGCLWNSSLPPDIESQLCEIFEHLSLRGPIERLLQDPEVTDILVEGPERIYVDRNGHLELSSESFADSATYRVYIENLLHYHKKVFDDAQPFVDFSAPDGTRYHLIGGPLSSLDQLYLSIRKPRSKVWTLDDLFSREMFTHEQRTVLDELIEGGANILVSGETGSGKTSLIRALLLDVPASERIIISEDVPELEIGRPNTAYLHTRLDRFHADRNIGLRELVRQALRMRPDRLVIGEIRGEEAFDYLMALNTGHHGCVSSIHANNAREALIRLATLARLGSERLSEELTLEMISRSIHAVIHCTRHKGRRRISEIALVRGIESRCFLLEYVCQKPNISPPQTWLASANF